MSFGPTYVVPSRHAQHLAARIHEQIISAQLFSIKSMSLTSNALYEFDYFVVDPRQRRLTRAGVPVNLPQKAFQLLLCLLDRPCEVVSKKELMDALWPQASVEEANLTQTVFLLRKALGEQAGGLRYVVTVPGEGYQFAARPHILELPNGVGSPHSPQAEGAEISVREGTVDDLPLHGPAEIPSHAKNGRARAGGLQPRLVGLALLVLAAVGLGAWLWGHAAKRKIYGTLVLADFDNATGDLAFDSALRQGLAAQLEQSPELGILSDTRIAQTLQFMAQPKGIHLSHELASQVCARTGSAATVEGSITALGNQYVLGLKVSDCSSGDALALDQEVAQSKEQVLSKLDVAANKLRRKLGESLSSVRKYDAPIAEVTTDSLPALEAYSLGIKAQSREDCAAAVALFKQAVVYDPNFAMAYSRIGVCDRSKDGVESTKRAYELRDRVSERERFYLASHYQQYALGDLPAARKILEEWSLTYPQDRDTGPNLLKLYLTTGEYERALPVVQAIVQNSPGTPTTNSSRLATTLVFLNRIDEAKQVLLDAVANHYDGPVHHFYLYEIYFLQTDSASMAKEAAFTRAQPGWEGHALDLESLSARYFGKFALGSLLSEQSVQTDIRDQDLEDAAGSLADAALQEALAGNKLTAERRARASLGYSRSADVESHAGMGFALAGDEAEAERMIEDIDRRYPNDTMAQVAAATTRAAILLNTQSSQAQARQALEALAPAELYMMSSDLVPLYVRGRAYLAAGNPASAAADFQVILKHPGITRNYVTGPLARLGLAQAEDQAGDESRARADYAEFLRLWRDADVGLSSQKLAAASLHRLQ